MNEKDWFARTGLLIGREGVDKLKQSHVLVAGLGGVGSYAAEAICRAGVGQITIADHDRVSITNLNRQLLALHSTIGLSKVRLMADRLKDINPALQLKAHEVYLKDAVIPDILSEKFDFVIDAIDTLSPKIYFIKQCIERGFPLVSSMGSGGRMDPMQIRIADIADSFGCPFAQVVRKKLHGLNIRTGFRVVFSSEPVPKHVRVVTDHEANKKSTVGTISYMPAIFGMMAASVVINGLLKKG
ncbi:MAG: ThiF family adenylyltransferase [Bacteroidales bacterium]